MGAPGVAVDRRTRVTGRPERQRTAYAVLVLSAALVAGCGQPTPPPPGGLGTVSVAIQPTITPLSTQPDVGASAPPDEGLDVSDHLKTTSCAAHDGVWSYTGSFTNPEPTELNVTVAIILVRTSDMSQVETKEITLPVPGGATVPVEAKAFYTSTATDLDCLTGATVKGD